MKNKEQIITEMCYAYRQDYDLNKDPTDPSWCAGMTPEERRGLYNTMAQIYENNIEPLLKHYGEKNGK